MVNFSTSGTFPANLAKHFSAIPLCMVIAVSYTHLDVYKRQEYATYIFPFIRDAMLRFRMGEEKWSVSSLTNYKMVRSMAWLDVYKRQLLYKDSI